MFHNKGISKKTGKPYENYKCKCGEIEWVDFPKKVEVQTAEEYKEDPEKFHKEAVLNLTKITEDDLLRRLDNIDSSQVGIRMEIRGIMERLDKMAEFLRGKVG